MFDLDPEVANDPFAAIQVFPLAATSRAERDQAALLRAKGDLRRVKVMVGDVGGELSGTEGGGGGREMDSASEV